MPCWTKSESTIAVDKMDGDLAKAAIAAAGYAGQISYENGQLTSTRLTLTEEHTAQVKRAYAAEVIKSTAKKFGWQTKQVAPFKYEIIKTTY